MKIEIVRNNADSAAALLKAFSNVKRLKLMCLLYKDARTVGDLAEATGFSQPIISQHLSCLQALDLVTVRNHDNRKCYAVVEHPAVDVLRALCRTVHAQEPMNYRDQ